MRRRGLSRSGLGCIKARRPGERSIGRATEQDVPRVYQQARHPKLPMIRISLAPVQSLHRPPSSLRLLLCYDLAGRSDVEAMDGGTMEGQWVGIEGVECESARSRHASSAAFRRKTELRAQRSTRISTRDFCLRLFVCLRIACLLRAVDHRPRRRRCHRLASLDS